MHARSAIHTLIFVAFLTAPASPILADSAKATCGVTKNGQYREKQSGTCTFSQRQGYIDLEMSNGRTYSLTPGNKANHFTDQQGEKVVRTQSTGDEQVYRWDNGREMVVTFDGGKSSGSGNSGGGNSEKVAVKDMGRYCTGEASAKFGHKPRDITTDQPFKDGSRYYMVWGKYPGKNGPQDFACTFMADGHYVGIEKK